MDLPNPQPSMTFTGIGGLCPAGTQCPVGSSYPTVCPPGQYAPADGLPACLACPSGENCEISQNAILCLIKQFQQMPVNSACLACPSGESCKI